MAKLEKVVKLQNYALWNNKEVLVTGFDKICGNLEHSMSQVYQYSFDNHEYGTPFIICINCGSVGRIHETKEEPNN